MKQHIYLSLWLLTGMMIATSCDSYLDDAPKGQKIPTTYADFEAFLRDEYGCHRIDAGQTAILLNDCHVTRAYLSYYPYWAANYNWDEAADRVALNNEDETSYYAAYAGISTFNLIIENAADLTECTEQERSELVAYARVLRAMNYFFLVNYYSDTYQASTAADRRGVPLILSADVGAAYTQPSVQAIYDFILADMEAAYYDLPTESLTVLHPNRATADAFYARLYLQMGNYDKALAHAEKALAYNDQLFDWREYYAAYQDIIDNPTDYTTLSAPNEYNFCENYSYRHGSSSYASTEQNIPQERAARFEEGDARFLARWKYYDAGSEQYYRAMTLGAINYEGMTTVEAYLIKAECLARTNRVDEAMLALNAVRETRILADHYEALTAATEAEALPLIIRTKQNEMILTTVPFCDARRLNAEGRYATTLTKQVDGATLTLSPTSHLWTFPIPLGAIGNSGNGTVTNNVEK